MNLNPSGISWTDSTLNAFTTAPRTPSGAASAMRLTDESLNLPHDAVPIEFVLKDIRGLGLNRAVVVRGKLCFRTALSPSLFATSLSGGRFHWWRARCQIGI